MANFTNSGRTLLKATYVPLKLSDAVAKQGAGIGATGTSPQPNVMQKVSYLLGLNIRPAEMAILQQTPKVRNLHLSAIPRTKSRKAVRGRPLIDVAKEVTTNLSASLMVTHGPLLAHVSTSDLEALGGELHTVRQQKAARVAETLKAIVVGYSKAKGTAPELVTQAQALQWAVQNQHPGLATLQQVANQYSARPVMLETVNLPNYGSSLLQKVTQDAAATKTLIDDFLLQFNFQPVGWLHLERLEMNPVGIEDGELVYSVPLTPKETVNITHREWSETTSTFETLVSDSFVGFSEQGVTDKTDISTATSNETKHSSAFDVNGQVSFAYNGSPYAVTTSAGVDYQTKADDSRSIKDSQAHSVAVTKLAAARTRKEHKQSFRVSSVAGSQDLSVRTLTNPSDSQTMRADYFRMMRRWQVDLIRYGLRMTYDLVIPNPGNALASKVSELAHLNQVLATQDIFPVDPSAITAGNYQQFAMQYGAMLDLPPQNPGDLKQAQSLTKTDNPLQFASMQFNVPDDFEVSAARIWAQYSFNGDGTKGLWFGVRDGAFKKEVRSTGGAQVDVATYDSDDPAIDPNRLFSKSLEGRSGQITVEYMWYHVDAGQVMIGLQLVPKLATTAAWQMKCWGALRQADASQYSAALKSAADRQALLKKELADYDSLTLRRMEREEIMRLVLLWIFGPSFQLVPTLYEQLVWPNYLSKTPTVDPSAEIAFPDPSDIPADWDSVRKYGEFIKFLNNAIEWENVLFFCYPYFWDLIENWPFKKFLVHPDPDHRVFLRAGCARVVLTVRPGFETAFAGLVDYFTLPGHPHPDPNAPPTPYVTIGEEIQNYAMTNYGHIPPANPDNNVRPLLHPLQIRVWNEMQDIITVLDAYNDKQHKAKPALDPGVKIYPTSLTDPALIALVPLTDGGKTLVAKLVLNDPWGRPYAYSSPGEHGEDYDLVCYGKSGNQSTNGEGLDAWLTSWAGGNVVSRWYEYTPTSALNVAVTMGPPQPTRF